MGKRKAGRKKRVTVINRLPWLSDAKDFLQENFTSKGDKEIAGILTEMYVKHVHQPGRKFTAKIVENKRLHLKLAREAQHLTAIRKRNTERGSHAIDSIREARLLPEGTETEWTVGGVKIKRVKHNDRFVTPARYRYEMEFGPVPDGYIVCTKDGNPENVEPGNLVLKTRQQHIADNEQSPEAKLKRKKSLRKYYQQKRRDDRAKYRELCKEQARLEKYRDGLKAGTFDEAFSAVQIGDELLKTTREINRVKRDIFMLPESAKRP